MSPTDHNWQPTAGYLYTLMLPPSGLAWEYLRRNSRYRHDWNGARDRLSDAIGHAWGLDRPGGS